MFSNVILCNQDPFHCNQDASEQRVFKIKKCRQIYIIFNPNRRQKFQKAAGFSSPRKRNCQENSPNHLKISEAIFTKILKSLVTIRMNEIFPCLACYGQKLNFFQFGNRDKDKHNLSETKRNWNSFFKKGYLRCALTSSCL